MKQFIKLSTATLFVALLFCSVNVFGQTTQNNSKEERRQIRSTQVPQSFHTQRAKAQRGTQSSLNQKKHQFTILPNIQEKQSPVLKRKGHLSIENYSAEQLQKIYDNAQPAKQQKLLSIPEIAAKIK